MRLFDQWTLPTRAQLARLFAREDVLAGVALCVVTALCLIPIWITRFLPLLDDSNHMSALYVLSGLRDPQSPLHEYYDSRLGLVPYSLHYLIGYALSYVSSVEVAHKLALSGYVVALSLGGWAWCLRTQRTTWLALPIPALAFGVSWAHGYHAFNISVPMYLLALVACDALLERFTPTRMFLALVAVLCCYLSHAVLAVLLIATLPVLALLHRPSLRASIASALLWFGLCAMFVREAGRATSGPGAWQALLHDGALDIGFKRLSERFTRLSDYAFDVVRGDHDRLLGCMLIALSLGATAIVAWIHPRNADRKSLHPERVTLGRRQWWLAHRSLVLLAIVGGIYLLGPTHLQHPEYMWIFAGRFVPLVLFFALLSPPITIERWPRALSLMSIGVVAAFVFVISTQYLAFGRTMQPLPSVAQVCPEGARLMTLGMQPLTHDAVDVPVLGGRIAGWVQVLHGGFDPYHFPRRVPFPFAHKKTLPAPRIRAPEHYAKPLRDGDYDCVLALRLRKPLGNRNYVLAVERGEFQMWLHRRLLTSPQTPRAEP